MSEKTALWTWRDVYEDPRDVTFDADGLKLIRSLNVIWESAEAGAAGVDLDEFDEVSDAGADIEALIDLFLTTATLPTPKGVIRPPYDKASVEEMGWMLEDIPDAEIKAQVLSGEDIAFEATAQDQLLWSEANIGSEGINCKRPFGTGNVSSDLRALMDPDKKLSNQAFGKLRKQAEARMVLYLMFFVQTAELHFDDYTRDKTYAWVPSSSIDREAGERIDRETWCDRVSGIVHSQCKDYTKTAMAVGQLVWEDRLQGDYPALNTRLRLHDFYEDFFTPRYVGLVREMLETGLEAFPETDLPVLEKTMTLTLLRVLNGTGDFDAARDLMQKHGIWEIDPNTCSLSPLNAEAVVFFESIAARMGLGQIERENFERRAFGAIRGPSNFFFDILHDIGEWKDGCPKDVPFYRYSRACAVIAQLQIMRGPYRA
jgi:hypothetical protein